METRQLAIQWWNMLSKEKKDKFFTNYKGKNFTPALKESQLTSREIEIIYNHR